MEGRGENKITTDKGVDGQKALTIENRIIHGRPRLRRHLIHQKRSGLANSVR